VGPGCHSGQDDHSCWFELVLVLKLQVSSVQEARDDGRRCVVSDRSSGWWAANQNVQEHGAA
jgi:hypothetical protein